MNGEKERVMHSKHGVIGRCCQGDSSRWCEENVDMWCNHDAHWNFGSVESNERKCGQKERDSWQTY